MRVRKPNPTLGQCEPLDSLPTKYKPLGAKCLVQIQCGQARIKLINHTNAPIIFRARMLVARFEPIEPDHVSYFIVRI